MSDSMERLALSEKAPPSRQKFFRERPILAFLAALVGSFLVLLSVIVGTVHYEATHQHSLALGIIFLLGVANLVLAYGWSTDGYARSQRDPDQHRR